MNDREDVFDEYEMLKNAFRGEDFGYVNSVHEEPNEQVSKFLYNAFDELLLLLGDVFSEGHILPFNYYGVKKMVKKLNLGYEKIHVCENDCMLFYGDDKDLENSFVHVYPYSQYMKYHKNRIVTEGVLSHLADGEEWKEFDKNYPDFAADIRNVGVQIYDASTKTNFMIRAALLWTISDFPGLGMCQNEGYHMIKRRLKGNGHHERVMDEWQLDKNIAGIICTLETKSFPALFDPMEHLPIHLPEECRLDSPIPSRLMYNIERLQRKMKQKVGNKARVEGSIAENYVHEELTHFCFMYFESGVETAHNWLGRNVVDDRSWDPHKLEAFTYQVELLRAYTCYHLDVDSIHVAAHHVLTNMREVAFYITATLAYVERKELILRLEMFKIYEQPGARPPRSRKGEGSSGRSALTRIQDEMFMRVVDETLAQARANSEEYMLTPEQIRLLAHGVVEGDSPLPPNHPITRETRQAFVRVVVEVLNNIYKTHEPGAAKGKARANEDDSDDGESNDESTETNEDRDMSGSFYDHVDFNLPQRFDITYVDSDSGKKRPIMIHRAVLGSLEQFFRVLIEHYAGDFPLWLSPIQARIWPVTDIVRRGCAFLQLDYCKEVTRKMKANSIQAEVCSGERLPKLIRNAEKQKIPLMAVVGPKEVETHTVTVRSRFSGELGSMTIDDLGWSSQAPF
ncbi:hypothetical protein AgCh_015714 [Apium graveolens]